MNPFTIKNQRCHLRTNERWRFALRAAATAKAGLCLPVQTVRRSADTSTGVILMSRQRDFTQQLVCGHAANLVNRLSVDRDCAQFVIAYSFNSAKIKTRKWVRRSAAGSMFDQILLQKNILSFKGGLWSTHLDVFAQQTLLYVTLFLVFVKLWPSHLDLWCVS